MSIVELLEKAKVSASKRKPADRRNLLIGAHILDSKGNWDSKFFPKKTGSNSK